MKERKYFTMMMMPPRDMRQRDYALMRDAEMIRAMPPERILFRHDDIERDACRHVIAAMRDDYVIMRDTLCDIMSAAPERWASDAIRAIRDDNMTTCWDAQRRDMMMFMLCERADDDDAIAYAMSDESAWWCRCERDERLRARRDAMMIAMREREALLIRRLMPPRCYKDKDEMRLERDELRYGVLRAMMIMMMRAMLSVRHAPRCWWHVERRYADMPSAESDYTRRYDATWCRQRWDESDELSYELPLLRAIRWCDNSTRWWCHMPRDDERCRASEPLRCYYYERAMMNTPRWCRWCYVLRDDIVTMPTSVAIVCYVTLMPYAPRFTLDIITPIYVIFIVTIYADITWALAHDIIVHITRHIYAFILFGHHLFIQHTMSFR